MMWPMIVLFTALPWIELGFLIPLTIYYYQHRKKEQDVKQQIIRLYEQGKITEDDLLVFHLRTIKKEPPYKNHCAQIRTNKQELLAVPVSEAAVSVSQPVTSVSPSVTPQQGSVAAETKQARKKLCPSELSRGTLPLITGVILVILSGFIFATTSWDSLSGSGKTLLICIGTVLFFLVSFVADKKLHIIKTSKAFYILGSIFLFVTVLACGYFGLLGETLSLFGSGRNLLLTLGMVSLEIALLAGLRKFSEAFYRLLCFYGLTLTVTFLLLSFSLSDTVFAMLMAAFALLLLVIAPVYKKLELPESPCKKQVGRFLQQFSAVYASYRLINLWFVSVCILLATTFSSLIFIAVLFLAFLHFYLRKTQTNNVQTVSLIMIILFMCTLLFHAYIHVFSTLTTMPQIISLSLLVCDLALLAHKAKETWIRSLTHFLVLLWMFAFVHLFALTMSDQLLMITLLLGVYSLALFTLKYHWQHLISNLIYWSVILFNILLHLFWSLFYSQRMISCLLTIISISILAAITHKISRQLPKMHQLLPVVLALLTMPVWQILEVYGFENVPYRYVMFGYFILLIIGDLIAKTDYQIAILSLGTAMAFFSATLFSIELPYLLCVAIYLSAKLLLQAKGGEKPSIYYCYAAACYTFVGCLVAIGNFTTQRLEYLPIPSAFYTGFYTVFILLTGYIFYQIIVKTKEMLKFQNLTRSIFNSGFCLFLLCSYMIEGLHPLYLVLSAAMFSWIYQLPAFQETSCTQKQTQTVILKNIHLLPCLALCWMPFHLCSKYYITGNLLYAGTLVFLVLGSFFFLRTAPLIKKEGTETQLTYQINWFCVLQPLVIVPLLLVLPVCWFGDQLSLTDIWGYSNIYFADLETAEIWRFVYLLLLAGSILQYCTLKSYRPVSLTIAGLLGCCAFCYQPFFPIPDLLYREYQLLPLALLAMALTKIWSDKKVVSLIQLGTHLFCLAILILDALQTNYVTDALIIEGLCAIAFLYAYTQKATHIMRLYGAILLIVAIYMTKGFWLSISWWVYLFTVGIGLIALAAVHEMKKRE